MLRLPFSIIEHPQIQKLICLAHRAPSVPHFPSARTVRRRLAGEVKQQQQTVLQQLPPNAKLSIALDCWTSPFRQAFMAVTGYFLDSEWNYREILLGFEPLHGAHSGANLSTVVLKLLQEHQITDRVLAFTTDNASNNNTLMSSVQEAVQSLDSSNDTMVIHVPCLAHVIQLSLKELLGEMKADPKNNTTEMEWMGSSTSSAQQTKEIANTLNKV